MPGVAAWLSPRVGPRRAYEPPACARGDRYVGHMLTLADRLAVAGFVVPRMRAGAMSRAIHVGATGRTITGEQLGAALLRRVDVEVDAVRPPTQCPKCGGKKTPEAHKCQGCTAADGSLKMCPVCGGKKKPSSRTCLACSPAAPRAACPTCGGRMTRTLARGCRSCASRARLIEASLGEHVAQRAIDAYKNGASTIDVGRMIGRSHEGARAFLVRSGVPIRSPGTRQNR